MLRRVGQAQAPRTPCLQPAHCATTPRRPTAVSLRRWLCAWLALLILAQMIGSTLVGLHGAWHHHRPSMQSAAPSVPVVRWQHGEAMRADAHAQMHTSGEAHDHAVTDFSVLPLGADTATEAVAQLGASLAPGADVRWSAAALRVTCKPARRIGRRPRARSRRRCSRRAAEPSRGLGPRRSPNKRDSSAGQCVRPAVRANAVRSRPRAAT